MSEPRLVWWMFEANSQGRGQYSSSRHVWDGGERTRCGVPIPDGKDSNEPITGPGGVDQATCLRCKRAVGSEVMVRPIGEGGGLGLRDNGDLTLRLRTGYPPMVIHKAQAKPLFRALAAILSREAGDA